jgi:cytochrome c peroxidase
MRIDKFKKLSIYGVFVLLFLSACYTSGSRIFKSSSLTSIEIPKGFPKINFPEDNAFTNERWSLGKKLFYDKSLSLDSSISCGSCHNAELAFSDSVALSFGVKKLIGTQNAPTLTNVAYHPYYTRLGGVSTLEKQILVPIQEHNEFNFNIIEIAKRLKNNSKYQALSKKAYNRELDYYVITRAISNFERSLISGNSKYDKYKNANNSKILSESEIKGMNLFFSDKTNCSKCHEGFNFTNYAFENNGLYEKYKDIGRKRLTEKDEDLEKFKVPTLRNIALTAPYMHDGSVKSLENVINHYNTGGKNNSQKSKLIKPLKLSESEKIDLIAFLKTLTDIEFTKNSKFKL